MSDISNEILFRVGGILHEARMEECYGKTDFSARKKWPETVKDFRRQQMDGQPWIDIAIAQVRALVKTKELEPGDTQDLLVDLWFHLSDTNDSTLRGLADRARILIRDGAVGPPLAPEGGK